jgi:hypothetical protein
MIRYVREVREADGVWRIDAAIEVPDGQQLIVPDGERWRAGDEAIGAAVAVPALSVLAQSHHVIQAFVVALGSRGAEAWQWVRQSRAPTVLTFLEIFDRMQALGEPIHTAHPLLSMALGSLEQIPQPGHEQDEPPPTILQPGEAEAILAALIQIAQS